MEDTLRDAAWGDDAFAAVRVARFRAAYRVKPETALGAHSTLLSTYIGSISQIKDGYGFMTRFEVLRQLIDWTLRADYHANALMQQEKDLDHDQLDVLSSWLVATAGRLPWRYASTARYFASRSIEQASIAFDAGAAKPHQLALACVTYARALMLGNKRHPGPACLNEVRDAIEKALSLEEQIRAEDDRLQALRQLVRVLKGAGELYNQLHNRKGQRLLRRALTLAEGEADTKSQAIAIRRLLGIREPADA